MLIFPTVRLKVALYESVYLNSKLNNSIDCILAMDFDDMPPADDESNGFINVPQEQSVIMLPDPDPIEEDALT